MSNNKSGKPFTIATGEERELVAVLSLRYRNKESGEQAETPKPAKPPAGAETVLRLEKPDER